MELAILSPPHHLRLPVTLEMSWLCKRLDRRDGKDLEEDSGRFS